MIKESMADRAKPATAYRLVLLAMVLIAWVWSGFNLRDTRLTWILETLPFLIALPILLLTYRKFPLTNLTYTLIAMHSVILMVGGHYAYAKVPLGFWMQHWFGWTRNNYDKIGHFMQGLGPAIYAREIIVRTTPLARGKMLGFLSVSVALAISALYEIGEWMASATNPADTEAFLGTQGYVWDTQTDMFFCLIGAITAIVCLTKLHNKYLTGLSRTTQSEMSIAADSGSA